MVLHDEHIDIIIGRLEEGGIKDPLLRQDLLDHLCCFIEEQDGTDFEVLLQEGLRRLAPNGVHEIEEERFFLFHFNKQLTMKRAIFFSGFATTFLITTGFTFKLMSWIGGSIILFCGNLALVITILLIAFRALSQRSKQSTAYNIRIFAGVLAAFLIGCGSMFKILHMPTANIQFVLGMLILNFVFLPMFFYQLYRRSVANIA